MKYVGSKNRHAKELLSIILKDRRPDQCYVETMVGGCNVIDKVDGHRIGCDSNGYLISMFNAVKSGWVPPSNVSENGYKLTKNFKDVYAPEFVGFVGFGCSYSGKFFGGYARGKTNGKDRNYADESARNLLRQVSGLKDATLKNVNYWELEFPANSVIYCDPPYKGTTGYGSKFDHVKFWNWVREKEKQGHTVFISEYQAPEDFTCIWEKPVNNTLVKDTGSKQGVERLFRLLPQ